MKILTRGLSGMSLARLVFRARGVVSGGALKNKYSEMVVVEWGGLWYDLGEGDGAELWAR